MGRHLVGTSGWSYPGWRPGFYPAGLRPEELLGHYATRLPAVELNATKYRLPSEEQFRRWAAQTPAGFRFAVKAPERVERRLDVFEERVRALGHRLGCVRVVVERPRDEGWLELLTGSAAAGIRYALDLRHPSWDGVETRLAELGWVRVGDERATAGWAYLRYREPPWPDAALCEIAAGIARIAAGDADVYAFFRHENEPRAPLAAAAVLDRLGRPAA